MRFFNFFKKDDPPRSRSFEAIFGALIQNLPENYETHRQYVAAVDYIGAHKWQLALDSLAGLADETGHYFSDDFWYGLAEAADKMGLAGQSAYCRAQPQKTKAVLGWTPGAGTTLEKISDTQYKQHVSRKAQQGRDDERRKKDGLPGFIHKEGFHMPGNGRGGTLYYVRDRKVGEIYWEISGVPQYDLLIAVNSVNHWALPAPQTMTEAEKQKLRDELEVWLKKQRIRADLY
jgi:hypothetical protein